MTCPANQDAMNLHIRHFHDRHRFSVTVEGHEAFLTYIIAGNSLIISHTFVPKPLKGRGIAAELVRAAYDYAHEMDMVCQATCSYAASWLSAQRHH